MNTTVGRNSLIQDSKIQEKAWEDTSEIISLQIYEAGSGNTTQQNTQLRGSLARDSMESTSICGFTELREIQREQVHFVGIKFPNLLTVESLTRCVSYILPNYSDASLSRTARLPNAAVFTCKSIKTDGADCRKLGEALKGSNFHSDLKNLTADVQRKIYRLNSLRDWRQIVGKNNDFIFPRLTQNSKGQANSSF